MKTIITILTGMLMLALGNFSNAQTCQASYTYSISGSSCFVQFINTSTGAFSYIWDFDDGNTSIQTSPIHLYNSNGNYWPVLFAYDSLGNLCDSAYQPITLNCSNPCNIVSQIASYSNPSCFGSCDGQATVTASGGITQPYTYFWSTSPLQTNSTATGLCTGTYTVTVVDSAGSCSSTSVVILTAPNPLYVIATGTNESYCGANDGYIAITQTGGTGPYQYSIDNWATSYTTPGFNGLAAGAYTISIMDANSCTATYPLTISCPPAGCQASFTPTWDTISLCNVSFQNNSTGASYYLWNFGDGNTSNQMNPQYTWTATGVYNVVLYAYDSLQNLCDSAYQLITVNCSNPCNLVSQIVSYSNPSCFGSCDGQATVTASGGTLPYTYIWSNSATTSTISQLCAGTYSVTVVDSAGSCYSTSVVILTAPNPLYVTATGTNESYCGANDGYIAITQGGGTGPYQYSIDNWATSYTTPGFNGLAAGAYTISIMDANGCTAQYSLTISCPPAGCQASFTYTQNGTTVDFTNTSTSDSSTASQWSWNFGDGNTSPNNDPTHTYAQPGTYTVCLYILDWNCNPNPTMAYCDTITVTGGNPCNLFVTITGSDADCSSGLPYGVALATVSGSSPPYTYLWSNGNTNPTMVSLPGTYTLIVYDANGCSDTGTVTISDATTISLQAGLSDETYCGANDGSITISATGGTPNYQYSIDCATFSSNNTFTGLSAGTYTVCVRDTFGCQGTDAITIACPGTTGIIGKTAEHGLSLTLYPNPVTSSLVVETEEPLKINLYSIHGKLLLDKKISATYTLNTSGLSRGIYLLKAKDEQGRVYSQKIIKE